jgi:hypothetical protein
MKKYREQMKINKTSLLEKGDYISKENILMKVIKDDGFTLYLIKANIFDKIKISIKKLIFILKELTSG